MPPSLPAFCFPFDLTFGGVLRNLTEPSQYFPQLSPQPENQFKIFPLEGL
jgi:hypothetical protein